MYTTVTIANQTWFAENLAYKIDGCFLYRNVVRFKDLYRYLYTWDQAVAARPAGAVSFTFGDENHNSEGRYTGYWTTDELDDDDCPPQSIAADDAHSHPAASVPLQHSYRNLFHY